MNLMCLLSLFFLVSMHSIVPADHETTQLFLSARVATDAHDVRTILNANFDTKYITDHLLREFLAKATAVVTLSAKNNVLQNPQPVTSVYLTELNLSHGTLQSFPIGRFIVAMPRLKKIDLSYNQIVSIASNNDVQQQGGCDNPINPWNSFDLEQINVSNNKLTEFDLNLINNAPNMTHANFSDNPIAEVKTASEVSSRKCCIIVVSNTQLDKTKKQVLLKKCIQPTAKYNSTVTCGAITGLFGLLIAGGGISLGVGIGSHLPVAASNILIPSLVFGGALVGGLAGCSIGHCVTPKNKRTYKAFTFDFGESDNSINANADYTQISMPLLHNQRQ